MLPTTLGNEEHAPILVAFYQVGEHIGTDAILETLGTTKDIYSDLAQRSYIDIDDVTTAVFLTDANADSSFLEACDGVVFILNAATGVSGSAIMHWSDLADLEIPRHILATNLFATHTDFDEIVAICRRVFSEEILVRYLPMADDDETKVVALYDLLQNTILDFSDGVKTNTSPDVEHIELTSDQREKLFENLAYLGLSDEALGMFQAGITPPLNTFESAWARDTVISISPLDSLVGREIVRQWISTLANRWNPTVESDEYQTHTSSPHFYGMGIGRGVARIWGQPQTSIEVGASTDEFEQTIPTQMLASALLADNVDTYDTLREQGDFVVLVAPTFD